MKITSKQITKVALLTGVLSGIFTSNALATDYTVKSGDSLWKISREYNTTVNTLKQLNGLNSDTIYVGQILQVSKDNLNNTDNSTVVHTVKSGDTLWQISRAYQTTISNIKSLNNLNSDMIYVGQKLKILTVKEEQNSTNIPKTHTVKSGDTLWGISKKYNINQSDIKKWNNLTSDTLYVGWVLQLDNSKENKVFNADAIISTAKQYIGSPYKWGGNTPTGFDCSGYLNYIFNQHHIFLPRTVEDIYKVGQYVSSPQKGDIVFFETYKAGPSHAGIYLGDNKFIHASTSKGVTISDMTTSYWESRYLGAKRYR